MMRAGKTTIGLALLLALALAGCAGKPVPFRGGKADQAAPPGVKIGKPYQVKGVWYYPKAEPGYDETGIASWYGSDFHGRSTANGETYNMNDLTAAHRTLPLPSKVRVTNLENGRSLLLRVNDRGPFAHGRIIDVSRRGAQLLGFDRIGTARVRVTLEEEAVEAPVQVASAEAGMPALPQGEVAAERLPPPAGVRSAPPPATARRTAQVAHAPPRAPVAASAPVDGAVSIVPVKPTQIFVQAGAFLMYDNANRLRARLASLGPTRITTAVIDRQEFFRVRLGPLFTVDSADRMLERVLAGGFGDARIVVD